MTKRTINLKQLRYSDPTKGKKKYEVVKLVNSTEFAIGEDLEESEVNDLINDKWIVNIVK